MRIQDTVQIRVSLVLRFFDSFTNQPIGGSGLRVEIPEALSPVKKPDGYYVFTGISGEWVRVSAGGPWYGRRNFEVPLRQDEEPVQVRKIRLYPNASCPLPAGTTCAYGKAEPGEILAAYCPGDGDYKRLLYDVTKGAEEISLYGREEEDLEGCVFCLLDAGETEGEFLELGEQIERARGIYRLKAPLSAGHKKIGTKLVPVRQAEADPEGNYFLPLSVRGSGSREYVFWRKSIGRRPTPRLTRKELAEGVRNRVDWREDG